MAPEGKSALSIWCAADPDYWRWLRKDQGTLTRQHKDEVVEIVIDALDRRFPGSREAVEVVDVATPVTYERYTPATGAGRLPLGFDQP